MCVYLYLCVYVRDILWLLVVCVPAIKVQTLVLRSCKSSHLRIGWFACGWEGGEYLRACLGSWSLACERQRWPRGNSCWSAADHSIPCIGSTVLYQIASLRKFGWTHTLSWVGTGDRCLFIRSLVTLPRAPSRFVMNCSGDFLIARQSTCIHSVQLSWPLLKKSQAWTWRPLGPLLPLTPLMETLLLWTLDRLRCFENLSRAASTFALVPHLPRFQTNWRTARTKHLK